jgi:hypothetical protein
MGRRPRRKMEKWMETKTMKLTTETLKKIIKEELSKVLSEASEEVVFIIKPDNLNDLEIIYNGKPYPKDVFMKEFPSSTERIKHLRKNIFNLERAAKGKMGSDSEGSILNFKTNIETSAKAIADHDLGGVSYRVRYK